MPTHTEMYVRVVCSYRENRGDTQFRGQDFIKYGERKFIISFTNNKSIFYKESLTSK